MVQKSPYIDNKSHIEDFFVAFRLAARQDICAAMKNLPAGCTPGQALIKAKLCDEALLKTVSEVRKLYKKTAPELQKNGLKIVLSEKSFIGEIMVALGFVSPEAQRQCLDIQQTEKASGVSRIFGEILIAEKACSQEEFNLGMRVQNWLRGVNATESNKTS